MCILRHRTRNFLTTINRCSINSRRRQRDANLSELVINSIIINGIHNLLILVISIIVQNILIFRKAKYSLFFEDSKMTRMNARAQKIRNSTGIAQVWNEIAKI
ncbi:Hypothetical_protein [Hexamita inflata]|uniref:Hypothetical_protein n=1 Tax=Hexamita inflata TaxID=28002 RepID=A0AA86NFA2_9EUKA|nr:Hypothetical protein HINF_LOCUS5646 [Hexamita inflata]